MKITNHKLVAEGSEQVNHSRKAKIVRSYQTSDKKPKDLIIHYTAGGLQGSLAALSGNNASVHLVIDRDGTIYQMASFDVATAHAGYSAWDEITAGFNNRSIGIELINMGWDVSQINASNVVTINHKHRFINEKKWEKYPKAQMDALIVVSKLLFRTYNLNRVLGHDDISAARKQDPGPAFDWDAFKIAVFGYSNLIGKVFKTKGEANFRKGDGTNYEVIKKLPKDYEVGVVETWGSWFKVYLCQAVDEVTFFETVNGKRTQKNKKIQGWIHSSLLVAK
jgi:N-acetylmuramoyl-L-alanine amidase